MQEEHFRPYMAVYCILRRGNDVLLAKRKNTGYSDGKWSMISGHVDDGESATDAMIREAKEEGGIAIRREDCRVVHVVHQRSTSGRVYIAIYFSLVRWEGDVTNREPEKCAALEWFPLNALPDELLPDVRGALELSAVGICYSEFGWK